VTLLVLFNSSDLCLSLSADNVKSLTLHNLSLGFWMYSLMVAEHNRTWNSDVSLLKEWMTCLLLLDCLFMCGTWCVWT